MKASLNIFLFLILTSYVHAQSFEISGSRNKNNFFSFKKDEGHYITKFESDAGYSATLSLENLFSDSITFRITVDFINYRGSIYTTDGGLGGASTTEATVRKDVLGLGIYPFNFTSTNKIFHLDIGGEFSFLMNSSTAGHQYSWQYGTPSKYTDLVDGSINNNFYLGLVARVAGQLAMGKKWSLTPQLLLYLGLSNEFRNIETDVHSFRASLGLGIKRDFGKN